MRKSIFAVPMMLILLCMAACTPFEHKEIRFGAGDKNGGFYAYAKALSALADEGTFAIESTAGSAENIRKIRDGELDMAIVQTDTLYDAYFGKGVFQQSGAVRDIAAVAAIYVSACHIVVRADSDIYSIADLRGKTISPGLPGSSTRKNAEQILTEVGLTFADVFLSDISFSDSAAALQSGAIDAFFCTTMVGAQALDLPDHTTPIRVLGMDDELIQRLMTKYNFEPTTIPAETYLGQHKSVATVGTKAILIAGTEVSAHKVMTVIQLLFGNTQEIKGTLMLDRILDVDFATQDIPIPFHEGTAEFYSNSGVQVVLYFDPAITG